MKVHIIGSRGYPVSYASAEDIVREFAPRFLRDGHEVTVHCWATEETKREEIREDRFNGVHRVYHTTPGGKFSGQFFVALKSSFSAAISDCDVVFYIFINSAVFGWIPRIAGKKIFVNIDGMMWKDPKWPWGLRHIFFVLGAYFSILLGKAITDSVHMQRIYKDKFKVNIDWCGYGCNTVVPERHQIDVDEKYPERFYLIMSRITPHNLTDVMVDGFILSGTKSHLLVSGHTPNTEWFHSMVRRSTGKNVMFLGLVKDQNYLSQLILHTRAYLHGHSLGGINPALVRVTSLNTPVICVDTVFNREVVESLNGKLQACVFEKTPQSVANAIRDFERTEDECMRQAQSLGETVREKMSWESVYQQYLSYMKSL